MCEECTRISCGGCPFAADGAEEGGICELCGEPVFFDGEVFASGDSCVCPDCLDCLTVDDVITLGGLRDVSDLLALLGFCRVI